MSRLPYKPDAAAGPEEIVAAIRERRGGTLLHLDRQLLYSPALAVAWNQMMGTVRNRLDVPPRLREIAICVVATINGRRTNSTITRRFSSPLAAARRRWRRCAMSTPP